MYLLIMRIYAKKCKMQNFARDDRSPDAQQFAVILARTGLSDALLAKLFGVNQSTVSRLRHAKIRKIKRYFTTLETGSVLTEAEHEELAARMIELTMIAKRNPSLRTILTNLHKIMHGILGD
jgi:hypothetical protein